MLVSRGVLCWLWAGMGRGGGSPVLWAGAPLGPASPRMGHSHPGCFVCALKTIFALSGVRKKIFWHGRKNDIYIPWWAVRGGGVSACGDESPRPLPS